MLPKNCVCLKLIFLQASLPISIGQWSIWMPNNYTKQESELYIKGRGIDKKCQEETRYRTSDVP